jgi:hypothetical protein
MTTEMHNIITMPHMVSRGGSIIIAPPLPASYAHGYVASVS